MSTKLRRARAHCYPTSLAPVKRLDVVCHKWYVWLHVTFKLKGKFACLRDRGHQPKNPPFCPCIAIRNLGLWPVLAHWWTKDDTGKRHMLIDPARRSPGERMAVAGTLLTGTNEHKVSRHWAVQPSVYQYVIIHNKYNLNHTPMSKMANGRSSYRCIHQGVKRRREASTTIHR